MNSTKYIACCLIAVVMALISFIDKSEEQRLEYRVVCASFSTPWIYSEDPIHWKLGVSREGTAYWSEQKNGTYSYYKQKSGEICAREKRVVIKGTKP